MERLLFGEHSAVFFLYSSTYLNRHMNWFWKYVFFRVLSSIKCVYAAVGMYLFFYSFFFSQGRLVACVWMCVLVCIRWSKWSNDEKSCGWMDMYIHNCVNMYIYIYTDLYIDGWVYMLKVICQTDFILESFIRTAKFRKKKWMKKRTVNINVIGRHLYFSIEFMSWGDEEIQLYKFNDTINWMIDCLFG